MKKYEKKVTQRQIDRELNKKHMPSPRSLVIGHDLMGLPADKALLDAGYIVNRQVSYDNLASKVREEQLEEIKNMFTGGTTVAVQQLLARINNGELNDIDIEKHSKIVDRLTESYSRLTPKTSVSLSEDDKGKKWKRIEKTI